MRILLLISFLVPYICFSQTDSYVHEQTVFIGKHKYYDAEKAKDDVALICEHLALVNNYKLTPVVNFKPIAQALYYGNRREIKYDPQALYFVYEQSGKSDYAIIAVFLHEIMHHLNFDPQNIHSRSKIKMECSADYGMGFYLNHMGCSRDESILVTNFMGENDGLLFSNGTYKLTHPPKRMRIKKILSGWDTAEKFKNQ